MKDGCALGMSVVGVIDGRREGAVVGTEVMKTDSVSTSVQSSETVSSNASMDAFTSEVFVESTVNVTVA